jgi:hypothetical protein
VRVMYAGLAHINGSIDKRCDDVKLILLVQRRTKWWRLMMAAVNYRVP